MNSLLFILDNHNEKYSLKENEHLNILSFNSKNNITVELCGEGASFEYRSFSALKENEQTMQTINVIHKTPNTKSFLFARHILNENSKAVFNGIVEVSKHSTNINSKQLVNSILLSKNAKVISKPELKIYCDDVECSHGSTCGNLSEDSMFYLQSRGIDLKRAKKILLYSFAVEVAKEHSNKEQIYNFNKVLKELLKT